MGSLAKIRVGRVTVNTHIFFFGLTIIPPMRSLDFEFATEVSDVDCNNGKSFFNLGTRSSFLNA
jgi:hypothetical protein